MRPETQNNDLLLNLKRENCEYPRAIIWLMNFSDLQLTCKTTVVDLIYIYIFWATFENFNFLSFKLCIYHTRKIHSFLTDLHWIINKTMANKNKTCLICLLSVHSKLLYHGSITSELKRLICKTFENYSRPFSSPFIDVIIITNKFHKCDNISGSNLNLHSLKILWKTYFHFSSFLWYIL